MVNFSSNPLDQNVNIAIGVTLPIRKGTTGYFEQSFKTIDQAKSNIKNLLLTNKGERPMQPTFGSDLRRLIFEQNSDDIGDTIKRVVTESINHWLPYVNIREILVERDSTNIDMYTIELTMTFTLSNDPNTLETVNFVITP